MASREVCFFVLALLTVVSRPCSEVQLRMDPVIRLSRSGNESGAPRMPMVEPMGMPLSWSSATVSTLKSEEGINNRALMALMTGCSVPWELT